MIAAYLAAMRRYATFAGRAPRAEYWWFQLSLAVLSFVGLVLDGLLFGDAEGVGAPIAGLVVLAHVLPGAAVGVRRLHDLDRSGWLLLVSLVPLVGPVAMVVWGCQVGTSGPNRFGPDPLASGGPLARPGRSLAAAARDVVAEVERLAGLRASGVLSESEFEALKAHVLTGHAQA